jgi:DNA-binding CsgD family transcriptional regulator
MTRKPIDPSEPPMALSPQQKTALWLYASDMMIKRPTAKEHLHRAYRNLGTNSARHALKVAYELGIFTPTYLRGAQEEIEAQAQIIQDQQETILQASEAMSTRVAVPERAIAKIQQVAMQLATMAHVTDGQGLADTLRGMSNDLDAALKDMGATPVESPLDGATRALEHVGLRGVNRVFLGVVLEDHPEIKHLADEWDWLDTEVRDKIAQHVVCDMLGLTATQYGQAIRDDHARIALMERFWATHQKWT